MGYNIERSFISKLIETKDFGLVKDLQIKPSYFRGEHKKVFIYIQDYAIKFGDTPTVRILEKKFPNYELESYVNDSDREVVGNSESLRHWCEEVRTKVKHNTLAEATEKVVEKLEDFKTDEALALFRQTISFIEGEVVETTDVDITKNTEDRKKEYLKRKENKGMQGISYGIPHIDYITKGSKRETLTTLIAGTGVGKTWVEILIGSYMMLNNCRVLQGVTEMSEAIMRDRYEAMLFSMCYGSFNYNAFKDGRLSMAKEKLFFEFLENDLPNFEPLILFTATSPMKVRAEIEKHNPDIVLIDGAYLMEDDQGAKDDWLRVAHITRDLKKITKSLGNPIFINTQADKNTSKKTGPGLESIMYTQAIGQDSDEVWGMYRDEVMLEDAEACIKMLKHREGSLGKVMMNWDFKTMNFSGIYSESQGGDEVQYDSDDHEIEKAPQKDNTIGISEDE